MTGQPVDVLPMYVVTRELSTQTKCSHLPLLVAYNKETSQVKARRYIRRNMKTVSESKTDNVAVGKQYTISVSSPTLTRINGSNFQTSCSIRTKPISTSTHPTAHTPITQRRHPDASRSRQPTIHPISNRFHQANPKPCLSGNPTATSIRARACSSAAAS